jgi:hypothetical protein
MTAKDSQSNKNQNSIGLRFISYGIPLILLTFLTLPLFLQAQTQPTFRSGVVAYQEQRGLADIIGLFTGLIKLALPIMVGLAVLVFFKGLIAFIAKSGDAKTHAEGRSLILWGIIALFVMVSVFGILRFFYSDLGFGDARLFGLPLLPHADSPNTF